ncbi:MAG: hypothetical protein WB622_14450 [Acidobacteriaceae bacterium]
MPPQKDWFAQNAPRADSGTSDWFSQNATQGTTPPESISDEIGDWMRSSAVPMLKDLGIGALKGAANTTASFDDLVSKTPVVGKWLDTPIGGNMSGAASRAQLHAQSVPDNTTQAVGRGIEQAGEFLLPGLGEEGATAKATELFPKLAPLIRTGYGALTSGLVNKAQGGGFGTGAAAGGVASGIGEGLKALAPALAESAIGVRKTDRAYGRQVGKAILNETEGFSPSSVAESAQGRLDELNPELEAAVANAPKLGSLLPARQIVGKAVNTATQRNAAKEAGQLEPVRDFLMREFDTGNAIPQDVPAPRLLDLRRGFGSEFVHNWNPEVMPGVTGTARQAYHSLSEALHEAAPGSGDIDQRISNLIPVAKRAESTALNAPIGQRVFNRFRAHTGALTSAAVSGAYGYSRGGLPQAVRDATLGLIIPEVLGSPRTALLAARTANSPDAILKSLTGGLLQSTRKKSKQNGDADAK